MIIIKRTMAKNEAKKPIKICDTTLEALFLHLKHVDDNGYYLDDGYDNTNKNNDDNYEDCDDFVIFCIRKS